MRRDMEALGVRMQEYGCTKDAGIRIHRVEEAGMRMCMDEDAGMRTQGCGCRDADA